MYTMVRVALMDADEQPKSDRRHLVGWVARCIIPHEPAVRAWLRPRMHSREDADDLIQDAYAKLSAITAVDQIANPRGYFFQVVRNLLTDHIRRERIIRIDAVAEIEAVSGGDERPGPDRIAAGRSEWARVIALLDALPERCRTVFRMRKIEGLPQQEIARRLGVTESIVENEAVKALKCVMQAMRETNIEGEGTEKVEYGRPAKH